jgi:hypothetical protein
MSILARAQPDAAIMCLAGGGPADEVERLRQLNNQWLTMRPALMAISTGYPAAEVRESAALFFLAAAKTIAQPASLSPTSRLSSAGRRQMSGVSTGRACLLIYGSRGAAFTRRASHARGLWLCLPGTAPSRLDAVRAEFMAHRRLQLIHDVAETHPRP